METDLITADASSDASDLLDGFHVIVHAADFPAPFRRLSKWAADLPLRHISGLQLRRFS